jgi:hypothetical protein
MPATFFEATIAHAFVVGSAVFGIFWGVVNALLIRKINMSDGSIIEDVVRASAENTSI